MDIPSFWCDLEATVSTEYRILEMYVGHSICSTILKTVRLSEKLYWMYNVLYNVWVA
jgi:hypothetical protein